MASVVKAHSALSGTASVASGGGIGVLLVWLLGLGGVDLSPAAAAAVATMLAAIAAAVHHLGIRGIAELLWRGEKETAEARYKRRHEQDDVVDPPK